MSYLDIAVVLVLAVANFPLYRAAFRTMFGSWENFKDAMDWAHRDNYNPFWFFTASGSDRSNNTMAELMLLCFFLFCAGLVFGEYFLLEQARSLLIK